MKIIRLSILFLLLPLRLWAQDPQFSQFYAAPLYLGPSFAGATNGSRIAMTYRDQWPKISGSFVTYSFSYDQYFSDYKSGLGVLVLRDEAGGGKLNTTNIGLQYSYNLIIDNTWHFRPGIHVYYYEKNIGFNRLLFADQLLTGQESGSSVEIPPTEKTAHTDMGLSLMVYNKKYWLGVAADHLMKLNQSLSKNSNYLKTKYSVYGGYKHQLNTRTRRRDEQSLSFSFLYKHQNGYDQMDIGAYLTKEPIMMGLWYRGIPLFKETVTHDAFSIMFGYMYEGVQVGYSYDFTISRLITTTGGAHEITLIYLFNQAKKTKRRKKITPMPCPDF